EEKVTGPRGRKWRDTAIRGHVGRGTGILNNESYIGRMVWNRRQYRKTLRRRSVRPAPMMRANGFWRRCRRCVSSPTNCGAASRTGRRRSGNCSISGRATGSMPRTGRSIF
ncbi:hypothetical protein HED54_26100, partial [Ochrobactrum anthropi ATCC 49188]|nr:hypothetical protein [Brucella anthropi ATCC 49188]